MTSVPLKRVARIVPGQSPPSKWVKEFNGEGLPFLQGNAEFGEHYPTPKYRCDSASKRASAGSVLVSVRAPVGALNTADQDYGIGRGLAAIVPTDVYPRYCWWWLHSAVEDLRAVATGSTYEAVSGEDLGGLRMAHASLHHQRAVADFLDAETARIDALIAKKHRLVGLLQERRAGHIEQEIRDLVAQHGDAPLRYLAEEITVGIVVTPARWYADEGIPALRGVNVAPGQITLEDLVHLSAKGHALHRKSELRLGDVVVVRTGQAGAAAVVPPTLAGANCIDLIVVRPSSELDPLFTEFVLNSDWTQKHVQEHSVGTIQSHFNVSAMKALPFPRAPLLRQRDVAEHLVRLTRHIDETISQLQRQIHLLRERRGALITAVVSGELEVPGVAA